MAETARRITGVDAHYGRANLGDAILEGLRRVGKDPAALAPDDLAPVDQFHTRGKEATLELARVAGLAAGTAVIDLGGGLGGPARTLAGLGCRVTVLDLTAEYCQVGANLTRRTGLGDRVRFVRGDATAPPFAPAGFDVVWTQHSSMNVEDKAALYRASHGLLRPGGRLALYEIMAGLAPGPIHFPVPWARDPAWSFLRPAPAVRALLHDVGFREVAWADHTAAAVDWFRQRAAAVGKAAAPPPLGFHLLLGGDVGVMFANQVRNLEEGRIAVIQAVFERP
jgi:SAM-dependent methyltransferase